MKCGKHLLVALAAVLVVGVGWYIGTSVTADKVTVGNSAADEIEALPANKSTDSPVDFAGGTKIFWDGVDITAEVFGSIDISKTNYFRVTGSFAPEDYFGPVSGFEIALLDAPEMKIDTGTRIGVLWKSPEPHLSSTDNRTPIAVKEQYYSYAQAGRTIKEINFTGLDKRYLKEVTADGVVLQFSEPGTLSFWYTITDSEGESTLELGYEFPVQP